MGEVMINFQKWKKWAWESIKLKYHWALLFVLAVPTALYFYFAKLSGDRFSTFSFSENLLAEAFGLAATIIIIERLLKHQRVKEWGPVRSKNIQKAKLHIESCIQSIFFPWDTTKGGNQLIKFGENTPQKSKPPIGRARWEQNFKRITMERLGFNKNPDRLNVFNNRYRELANFTREVRLDFQNTPDSAIDIAILQEIESMLDEYRDKIASIKMQILNNMNEYVPGIIDENIETARVLFSSTFSRFIEIHEHFDQSP